MNERIRNLITPTVTAAAAVLALSSCTAAPAQPETPQPTTSAPVDTWEECKPILKGSSLAHALDTNENAHTAYDFLIRMGLPYVSAAAVTATMYYESRVDPNFSALDGTTKGILGWSQPSWSVLKKAAKVNKASPRSLDMQLEFFNTQITQYQSIPDHPEYAKLQAELKYKPTLIGSVEAMRDNYTKAMPTNTCVTIAVASYVLQNYERER